MKRNDCLHSVHQKRYTTITQAIAKYGYVANTVAKRAYEELCLLGYHFAEHPDIDPNNYGFNVSNGNHWQKLCHPDVQGQLSQLGDAGTYLLRYAAFLKTPDDIIPKKMKGTQLVTKKVGEVCKTSVVNMITATYYACEAFLRWNDLRPTRANKYTITTLNLAAQKDS